VTPRKITSVGMAEIAVSAQPVHLSALGLGSCIGLIAQCRRTGISGMAHIMLPESFAGKEVDKVGKFANTAVPALIAQMQALGAGRDLHYAYAGGAQVFSFGAKGVLEIGLRNSVAVESILAKMGARVIAKEVGGSQGRTLTMDMVTGEVTVKTPQDPARRLCLLAPAADNLVRRAA
jgi:chemotaxis protein CheD